MTALGERAPGRVDPRIAVSAVTFGAAGGDVIREMLAVLERPIHDQPSRVAVLDQ